MNQTEAEGFLIASAINMLMENDDEENPGCCLLNCGPCSSLHWLRDNNPGWANRAVIACYGKTCWGWQDREGRIDWPQLTAQWDLHQGCAPIPMACGAATQTRRT